MVGRELLRGISLGILRVLLVLLRRVSLIMRWRRGVSLICMILLLGWILLVGMLTRIALIVLLRIVGILRSDLYRVWLIVGRILRGGGGGVVVLRWRWHRGRGHACIDRILLLTVLLIVWLLHLLVRQNLNHFLHTLPLFFLLLVGGRVSAWSTRL